MLYTKMNVLGVTTVASYYTERLSHLHSPYIYSLHQKPHQTVDNFSIYFDDMIWDIDIETMCLHCDIYRSLTSYGCFCNDVTLTRMLIHLSFISCSAWNDRWTKRILEVAWKLYILVETIYWLKVLILFKFTGAPFVKFTKLWQMLELVQRQSRSLVSTIVVSRGRLLLTCACSCDLFWLIQ